jgi:hypothetical protein
MLLSLYAEDPVHVDENDEPDKILRNNVAWPQGYLPRHHVIKKIIVRDTKEELHYR